jgi:hypothetical protein
MKFRNVLRRLFDPTALLILADRIDLPGRQVCETLQCVTSANGGRDACFSSIPTIRHIMMMKVDFGLGRPPGTGRTSVQGRRLPLAISVNERLLVAVAHSEAARPPSASICRSVAWPEYPRRVGMRRRRPIPRTAAHWCSPGCPAREDTSPLACIPQYAAARELLPEPLG